MSILTVRNACGPTRLEGSVTVSGSKNSAIPIILGSAMAEGEVRLGNIPQVGDVEAALALMGELGCGATRSGGHKIRVMPGIMDSGETDIPSALKIRSSILLLGIAFGKGLPLRLPLPGGCRFGPRLIDIHVDSLRLLGADISMGDGGVRLKRRGTSGRDGRIRLRLPSVSATINIVIAASVLDGVRTTIENAAKEPEVEDFCRFMAACGARIEGAGSDTVSVSGVDGLRGADYSVIPDRIEASTYALASVATGSDVEVRGAYPPHMASLLGLLREAGAVLEEDGSRLLVSGGKIFRGFEADTGFYPGLPSDVQPMLTVIGLAGGGCSMTERVYERRTTHVGELRKMGAGLAVEGAGPVRVTAGKSRLMGAAVNAPDLRAGAALVLAALVAEGETTISNAGQISRGYEDIAGKLGGLGADITASG
jgi:UDP-N-acetylglucosamine 1-carboxyvinyltransferase